MGRCLAGIVVDLTYDSAQVIKCDINGELVAGAKPAAPDKWRPAHIANSDHVLCRKHYYPMYRLKIKVLDGCSGRIETEWKRSRLSPNEAAPSPKSARRRVDGEEVTTDSEPYEEDDRASKEGPEPPSPPSTSNRDHETGMATTGTSGSPSSKWSSSPEGSPTSSVDLRNFEMHKKKSPIEILARVFPRENRSILNVVLQRNGGDVLQAIDDLLSTKEPDSEKTVPEASPEPASPSTSPPVSRIPSPRQANSLGEPTPPLSGFSNPHNFFSSAPPSTIAMGALPFRRPYSSSPGTRGLLAVPTYSGFFQE
ncbi:DMA domain-containing protein [Caerostris extrusa]|uniref:DMA domain-containing protein n=1 Tax=Caerostris extrusa TaxID=172846 RepID=A0AAV4QL38_CAEEX|nr:DMA domain-containing protein [Caerostris extrusa]